MTKYIFPLIALPLFLTSCGQTDGLVPTLTSGSSTDNSCPPTGYQMYVTATSYAGNLGGIAGADAKCMSDANYPGSGTYKALIVDGSSRRACTTDNCSGGTGEHIDWVLRNNATYCKTDGTTIITTTNAVGLLSYPLAVSLASSSTSVWTGLMSYWKGNVDCSNWTSSTMSTDQAHNGNMGDAGSTSESFAGDANAFAQCGNTKKIICVEQ